MNKLILIYKRNIIHLSYILLLLEKSELSLLLVKFTYP